MLKHLNLVLKTFLLLSTTLFYLSCTGGAASSSFGDPTGLPPDGIAGTSDGIASAAEFYIGIDSAVNSIAHVHDTTDFSTKCAIKTTDSLKDITCKIDIPEAELFVNGLSLKYNVPPGMCRYFRRRPYWFYNQEVGKGPSSVLIKRSYVAGALTSSTCSVDGSADDPLCVGYPEVTINPATKDITCVYDRSKVSGGNNCCTGDYNLTITDTTRDTPTSTPNTTTESNLTSWSTSITPCLGGAARYNWGAFTTFGYPVSTIEKTKIGIEGSYALGAPIDKVDTPTTIDIANDYDMSGLHSHTGFGPVLTPVIPARTSNLPYFIDPIDDRNGSLVVSGHESYDFECLDEAFEVLHRIRVYVREWDTYQDYANYITSTGSLIIPDRGNGVEGVNCAGLPIGSRCDDFYDLDDFIKLGLGASYDTTLGGLPFRDQNFPYILYK